MKCPLVALLRFHVHVAHMLTILKMRETIAIGGRMPMASAPAECRQFLESYFKAKMAVLSIKSGFKPI